MIQITITFQNVIIVHVIVCRQCIIQELIHLPLSVE